VRLALDPSTAGAIPGSRLRPGTPAAHPVHRLRLLPSGPDRVHGSGSRGTRPSTLLAGGCPVLQRPQARDRPGVSRVSGTGDPEPPTQHGRGAQDSRGGVAETKGFEPLDPLRGSHALQACRLVHSRTSPVGSLRGARASPLGARQGRGGGGIRTRGGREPPIAFEAIPLWPLRYPTFGKYTSATRRPSGARRTASRGPRRGPRARPS
jgi:hypothetical protein